jgi:hypothetical protein
VVYREIASIRDLWLHTDNPIGVVITVRAWATNEFQPAAKRPCSLAAVHLFESTAWPNCCGLNVGPDTG